MALTFDQLKAAFGKRNTTTENTGFWDKFYPFYKMGYNEMALFRFVPDADQDNPLGFVVENKYHELLINGKKKKIACLHMYGEDCPLCSASKAHYDAGDEKMGKAFWRKIDIIAAGLIINSPFDYPIAPTENPVRLVSLTTKLFKRIETSIASGDFDDAPYDFDKGTDFKIMKTQQGEYADYSSSEFVRKSTAINPALMERLELLDLKSYRFAKVGREAMEAHMEAFMTGKTYEGEEKQEQASQSSAPEIKRDVPTVTIKTEAPEAHKEDEQKSSPAPEVSSAGMSTSERAKALMARVNRNRAVSAD